MLMGNWYLISIGFASSDSRIRVSGLDDFSLVVFLEKESLTEYVTGIPLAYCGEYNYDIQKGQIAWVSEVHLLNPDGTKERVEGFDLPIAPYGWRF
jgi:hypothetical protein